MPHPGSDYQNWRGEPLPRDPYHGDREPWLSIPVSAVPVSRRAAEAIACGEDDFPPSVESLVEFCYAMAKRMSARRSENGLDRDDLESEAMYALFRAARGHVERGLGARVFRKYARKKIKQALDELEAAYGARLLGIPKGMKRAVAKVKKAVDCLDNRGIHRPNVNQIAGEAILDEETVEEVMAIPGVVALQSVADWASSRSPDRRQGEPTLIPLFGPQPGFTPQTTCDDIHRGPIRQGSPCCCMAGNESGVDHLPIFRRDRETDPRPEAKRRAVPPPVAESNKAATRRERRQLLFPPSPN
jgi:hypothetical protein